MHLIRQRLRNDDGFAMIAVIAVMAVATLIAAAAVQATDGDRPLSAKDKVRKQAYAAAEAGVNDYMARLVADVDYWKKCANDTNNPSLNDPITNPTAARNWRPIGTTGTSYSVEILPANGAARCDEANPANTFIDNATGTFRIRATGKVDAFPDSRRTVVGTFRRRGFLDYVYFTDLETNSPELYIRNSRGQETVQRNASNLPIAGSPDVITWAKDTANGCARYYRRGRASAQYRGLRRPSAASPWTQFNVSCGEINFLNGDQQRGPFHTNDEIMVCGNPKFGRNPSDDIEISAPGPPPAGSGSPTGWRNTDCGSGAPGVNDPTDTTPDGLIGTLRISSPPMEMPPRNTALRTEALPRYRFVGRTSFDLEGDTMRALITATREDGTTIPAGSSVNIPRNGVVYVSNRADQPCNGYDPRLAEHTVGMPGYEGCGDLWIQGDYNHSVTFGSDNDIVIENNLTRDPSDDVLLGLIADEWIRIHHKTDIGADPYSSCTNRSNTPRDVTVHAALLALNDSFTVDRWFCGASLGTLNIVGAIAQKYRGYVTEGGGGYIKNYQYDQRLRFRSPPKFLDPVKASWRIQTQVEQVPAT
jgi:hypothetical protein